MSVTVDPVLMSPTNPTPAKSVTAGWQTITDVSGHFSIAQAEWAKVAKELGDEDLDDA